ncbi:MAG TPA: ATP-binding protein [Planctomycetota bacterium]|nr:ATP-binding protein [Planctomycetota bacterium]
MSIRARLIALSALLVALPAGIVGLNVAHARRLSGDAPMIDFAGSERMRAFMTAGLAAFYMRRPAEPIRGRIEEELDLWERIRRGLLDGDSSLGLKGTRDEGVRGDLEAVGDLFRSYRTAVLGALDESASSPASEREARANEILSGAFGLYGHMDRVTRRLQEHSEGAIRSFRNAQLLLACAIGGIGTLALLGGHRYVLAPLPQFLAGLRAVGRGELRTRVPEEGPAEVVSVARAFNAMGEGLERARGALLSHERELADKNRELAHASRLKSEFLANMSHELRTPLNAVLGYSALLRRGLYGEVNPRQREALEGIAETGGHLLELINDVLDLSRIEAGKLEVRLEPVNLEEVLADLGRSVEPLVRGKGLGFSLLVARPLPVLVTDGDKVRRVLLNFLSNAVKFTPAGSIEVRAASAAGWEETALSVVDSGIGIRDEQLPHIFEDFRQGDGSASREYGGTGLGLSISLRLARMIGGRIEVETAVGKGSTFTLVLPRSPRPGSGGEVRFHGREEPAATRPGR